MISLIKAADLKAWGHKYTNSCYDLEGLSAGCNMAAVLGVIPGADSRTVRISGKRTEGLTAWPLALLIGLLQLNSDSQSLKLNHLNITVRNPVIKRNRVCDDP